MCFILSTVAANCLRKVTRKLAKWLPDLQVWVVDYVDICTILLNPLQHTNCIIITGWTIVALQFVSWNLGIKSYPHYFLHIFPWSGVISDCQTIINCQILDYFVSFPCPLPPIPLCSLWVFLICVPIPFSICPMHPFFQQRNLGMVQACRCIVLKH